MEKEFVPFELAVELKELGFKDNCLMLWTKRHTGEITLWESTSWDISDTGAYELTGVNAPLWQQVFDWFRVKHNLCYFINFSAPDGFISGWEDLGYNEHGSEFYNTYMEARQACLEKLIETVKPKTN